MSEINNCLLIFLLTSNLKIQAKGPICRHYVPNTLNFTLFTKTLVMHIQYSFQNFRVLFMLSMINNTISDTGKKLRSLMPLEQQVRNQALEIEVPSMVGSKLQQNLI